jgi:hypothetical protein
MPASTSDRCNHVEADLLKKRAREAREQARTIRLRAQVTRRKARLAREQRSWARSPEAMLPPLDYRLPPLPLRKAAVTRCPLLCLLPTTRTTLYVWGRGELWGPSARLPIQYTEAARQFAAQRGWSEWAPDTWACEIELPFGLSEALEEFEPVLRRDPAIVGWALRTVRAALALPDP